METIRRPPSRRVHRFSASPRSRDMVRARTTFQLARVWPLAHSGCRQRPSQPFRVGLYRAEKRSSRTAWAFGPPFPFLHGPDAEPIRGGEFGPAAALFSAKRGRCRRRRRMGCGKQGLGPQVRGNVGASRLAPVQQATPHPALREPGGRLFPSKIPWGWIAARSSGQTEVADPLNLETTDVARSPSLELSRKSWLITSLSPGNGEKMSRRGVAGEMSRGCYRGLPS